VYFPLLFSRILHISAKSEHQLKTTIKAKTKKQAIQQFLYWIQQALDEHWHFEFVCIRS
jgi:hypothetical protein